MTEGLSHQICQESLLKSCSLRNHGYTVGGGGADSGGGMTFSVTSCRETDMMNFQFEWKEKILIELKDMKKFHAPQGSGLPLLFPIPSENIKTQTTWRLKNIIALTAAGEENTNHKTGAAFWRELDEGGMLKRTFNNMRRFLFAVWGLTFFVLLGDNPENLWGGWVVLACFLLA